MISMVLWSPWLSSPTALPLLRARPDHSRSSSTRAWILSPSRRDSPNRSRKPEATSTEIWMFSLTVSLGKTSVI